MIKILSFLLISIVLLSSCEDDLSVSDTLREKRNEYIVAGKTGSGIFYRDLNPDWQAYAYGISGDSINLDIDSDFITDISIRYETNSIFSGYSAQTTVSAFNGTSFSMTPKNENESIQKNSSWSNSTTILGFTKIDFATNDTTSIGPWISMDDKFLAVSIGKNGRTLYGWIRMSLLIHPATVYLHHIIVKDFACQKEH